MRKTNYTKDNTIVIDVKTKEYSGEVDLEMYDDVLGKEKVENAYEENGVNTIDKGDRIDGYPVKIEVLKRAIEKFEKEGCNYISIEYNCDHPDYTFYGVDVHAASEEEIEEISNKEKKEKEEKAAMLRKKAEEFEREAKKLEE